MASPKRRRNRRVRVAVPKAAPHVYIEELFACFGLAPLGGVPSAGGFEVTGGGDSTAPDRALTYLADEVLTKYDDGKSSSVKVDAAISKWKLAEQLCERTNIRLSTHAEGCLSAGFGSLIERARQLISWALGEFDWNEAVRDVGFGPGATTRVKRANSAAAFKFEGIPHATPGCAALADAFTQYAENWRELVLSKGNTPYFLVEGNRVTTVPKNYKTDRVIAIEPCWNSFFQRGIGRVLRNQLRRLGLDLRDQTRNQKLAEEGSRCGTLATIDLSMASDCVSYELVKQLMPFEWFCALEQVRSPFGVLLDGSIHRYHKFSSMGNGYTFELETLIFWALAKACIEEHGAADTRLSVYGDDIIVPVGVAPRLLQLLEYCGFVPNASKTHIDGPFRESCGKHFYEGRDISPFYVRKPITTILDYFLLHNNIWRWSKLVWFLVRDPDRLKLLLEKIRGMVPGPWQQSLIPDGHGDGAFIGSFDAVTPQKALYGWCGWRTSHVCYKTIELDHEGSGRLLSSLFKLDQRHEDAAPAPSTSAPVEKGYWISRGLTVSSWHSSEPYWVFAVSP